MAKLIGIARRTKRGETLTTLDACPVAVKTGLEGDYKGVARLRQVTVLRLEDWKTVLAEVGQDLPWITRRANLLVEGLPEFGEALKGRHLRLGEVRLQVVGETEPCDIMEAACPGLRQALTPLWRGGLFGRVIVPATLSLGDDVFFED